MFNTLAGAQPRLPAGPRSRVLSSIRLAGDICGAFEEWERDYGQTFTLRDLTGTTVFTSDPEMIKELVRAPLDTFDGGIPQTFDVVLGRRSVILTSGAEHRRLRKALNPHFCRAAMPKWGEQIAKIAEKIGDKIASQDGFGCRTAMSELTTRVIVRVLFDPRSESEEDILTEAATEVTSAIHPSFLVARQTQRSLGGLLPYHRFREAARRFEPLLVRAVARARREGGSASAVVDALALGRFDDGEEISFEVIRDNVYSVMMAGYETTAYTLTWALYYLLRNPEVLARLRAELSTLDDEDDATAYTRNAYVNAVLDEAMRIRTPAPYTTRRLARPWTFGQWNLPAGTLVGTVMALMHRDPKRWVEPDKFRPERFYGKRPRPYDFMPFGFGDHRCLGAMLSKFEGAIALGTLISRHDLELREIDEVLPVRTSLSVGPDRDIRMAVTGPAPGKGGSGGDHRDSDMGSMDCGSSCSGSVRR
ncbi:cytochrome P450 [Pseudenhygromyxa sp. WMMC2535]|uniref:cytochrome P450 n=1 Tax=Pseudenhygromyxa sp. WMMC2535 TaxID=2712867 RepID=UPI001555516A|nr:cytochrome P450 [Pseudenhygromyxa sp. WMMC2535]NVB40505.1 cytochrome P450 [Pseudenhygromyxa sp. WMMC2535]